ncbi:TadE family protein, partial [Streptomyces boluensis]
RKALTRFQGDRGSVGPFGSFGNRRRKSTDGDTGTWRGAGDDTGSATLEFAGLAPLILAVVAILWQCVLFGYSWSLAGNAADEGARAGAVAAVRGDDPASACAEAARAHLPTAWEGSFSPSCGTTGGVYQAHVEVDVPLFLPGFDAGWHVSGEAGAAQEGGEGAE